MRYLIYGGGAVGLGLASCLIKAAQPVDILARPDTVGRLRSEGLFRTGIFGDLHADPHVFEAYEGLDHVKGPYDYVLVCTKTYDTHTAAKDLAAHPRLLAPEARLILCQNGWGNAEIFTSVFDRSMVYNARIITGFERTAPNKVQITVHADPILIGSLFSYSNAPVEPVATAITSGDIPCHTTQDIAKDLWAKMLFNCTLNPLEAILDGPYGLLGEDPATRSIMERIVDEIFAVMEADRLQTHWQTAEQFLQVFYGQLIPSTAAHRSSMLQDLRRGRRTEIDSLNGQVISIGQRYGIDTLIRFLEACNYQRPKSSAKKDLSRHPNLI